MKIRPLLFVPMAILAVFVGGTASSAAGIRTPESPGIGVSAAVVQPHAATLPAVSDAVFHTITPCRIVDSRSGDSGHNKFLSGTQRAITVTGTAGFAPQGGKSGGCGIPLTAVGITASVTTTQSANSGYLVGWPTGTTKPNANFATYNKAVGMTVGANLSLSVNNSSGLTLYNFGGPTQVIIDVTGYYTLSDSVLIDVAGARYYGGQTVLTSSETSTGEYVVEFNHSLVGCAVVATPWSSGTALYATVDYLGGGSVGGQIHVHVKNSAGAAMDGPFMVQATC